MVWPGSELVSDKRGNHVVPHEATSTFNFKTKLKSVKTTIIVKTRKRVMISVQIEPPGVKVWVWFTNSQFQNVCENTLDSWTSSNMSTDFCNECPAFWLLDLVSSLLSKKPENIISQSGLPTFSQLFLVLDNWCLKILYIYQGPHCTGKRGKMATTKLPVRENTGNLEIWPKHREFSLLKL